MTREEAIKQLKGDITESCATFSNQWEKDEETISMAISALSTNTRPNRHARWVEVNDKLLCSCCSQGNVTNYKYPFCHWCGADMRGKAE